MAIGGDRWLTGKRRRRRPPPQRHRHHAQRGPQSECLPRKPVLLSTKIIVVDSGSTVTAARTSRGAKGRGLIER